MHPDERRDRLDAVLISPEATIARAVERLERAGTGALLVCDRERRLIGLLTDGDVRRAILAGVSFDRACVEVAKREPVVATADVTPAEALQLMDRGREFVVNHLPLVTADGVVVGLLLRSDLVTREQLPLSAVIMAGGFGKRLLPLTEQTPKPMLRVGDRPLLERTIGSLRDAGIARVAITTHHLADRITGHFGDGSGFGVELSYVSEDSPLGTAGALRLLGEVREPVLVINGDILTGISYADMLRFHRANRADMTVGVRRCDVEIPYGVLETDGAYIRGVREKPRSSFLINAGIYLLEPAVHRLIPDGRRFDMTDLIQRLLDEGRRVASFPIVEYWLDIGQRADYEQAQLDIEVAGIDR
ncbi:MAG TPA: nucleotidyltransferase family protein [Gemmatimonadaceae bacterium]